jgi:hypothetical protein
MNVKPAIPTNVVNVPNQLTADKPSKWSIAPGGTAGGTVSPTGAYKSPKTGTDTVVATANDGSGTGQIAITTVPA